MQFHGLIGILEGTKDNSSTQQKLIKMIKIKLGQQVLVVVNTKIHLRARKRYAGTAVLLLNVPPLDISVQ